MQFSAYSEQQGQWYSLDGVESDEEAIAFAQREIEGLTRVVRIDLFDKRVGPFTHPDAPRKEQKGTDIWPEVGEPRVDWCPPRALHLHISPNSPVPDPGPFPNTLTILTQRFRERFPDIEAREDQESGDIGHTLWMIEQIPTMEDQDEIILVIGWIGSKAHELGLIAFAEFVELTEKDIALLF